MSKLTWKPLLFLSFLFICLLNIPILAQQDDYIDRVCNYAFNYTTNSTFRRNLDQALGNLPTTNSGYGFFNISSGQNPERANAIALCRGDSESIECGDCLNKSIVRLRQECPNEKDAVLYYNKCMVKYSNETILGKTEQNDFPTHASPNNATDPARFHQDVVRLLGNLTAQAAGGGLLKYATGTVTGPNATVTYGLVQCIPDLTNQQCSNCLNDAVSRLADCCFGSTGVRVLLPLCNLRYEDYRFHNDVAVLPPPAPSPHGVTVVPTRKRSNLTRIVTSIVITIAAFIIIVLSVWNFAVLRKKRSLQKSLESKTTDIVIVEFLEYDLDTVKAATNDFSDDNKIGQGGFGSVYKGKLEDGRVIAVKRLSRDSGQGEQQFKNEVLLVAKLHHRNLLGLLGYCLEEKERLLIYDFLPNSSLDTFLFDENKRSLLDWDTRYNIIEGVARGLLYLHEDSRLRIIHRDLKASNVLLDDQMNAKITDFGMARLCNPNETQGNTATVVGTYGYMAPEYVMHGQFSVKLDVFSFGVLVLEIITGKHNQSFQSNDGVYLLSYVWGSWRDGTLSNIIDPILLKGSNSLNDVTRSIHIALLCVQQNDTDRPTMSQVVLMLGSDSFTLELPLEPAFFIHSTVDHVDASKKGSRISESTLVSVNNVSKSEMTPR